MVDQTKPRLPKALDKTSNGIRSGFGLFRRTPEPLPVADQQEFMQRLEEVLGFEIPLADLAPVTQTVPADDFAIPAAAVAAPALSAVSAMEQVVVAELVSVRRRKSKATPLYAGTKLTGRRVRSSSQTALGHSSGEQIMQQAHAV
ncbi:MAG: hypothetical protein ABSG51_13870 [Terracidiphilus sp.]|jgi:hypothetical protein